MNFKRLATYFQKLEQTSSRNEMTEILAEMLKKASPEEIGPVCYLALGRLAPLYESLEFNMATKTMLRVISQAYEIPLERATKVMGKVGDLGKVVEQVGGSGKRASSAEGQSVVKVYKTLLSIAEDKGQDSQERKVHSFAKLLKTLNPLSAKFIVRLPVGALRLGFSDLTLLDALSWMEKKDKSLRKDIERAFNAAPNIGLIAETFKRKGVGGLGKIKVEVGRPILPMRCQRADTAEEMMERMGGQAAAEPKFDGSRVQIHLGIEEPTSKESGGAAQLSFGEAVAQRYPVKLFSRSLEDITPMFPDLVQAVSESVEVEKAILDGEAVGFDKKTGGFLPFQETIQRKRKHGVKEKMGEIPLKLFVFDVLFLDGKDLLGEPYQERRRLLEEVVVGEFKAGVGERVIQEAPLKIVESSQELRREFDKAIGRGLEGLVVKNLESTYEAGARGYSWIKFKGELDTIDCVVLGYYFGRGKRAAFGIGAFLVGVYGQAKDEFVTVAKIGTGLKDEEWQEMKKRCDSLRVEEQPKGVVVDKTLFPDVWVRPEMVVEIKADEITKSPTHSAKYALRFPRVVGWREDKKPKDATTLVEVTKIYSK